jgi:ATP-dependent Zn protease
LLKGDSRVDDTPSLISILAGWFPMLLLIAVWIYFMRRMGGGGNYMNAVRDYMNEHIAETKRINANLERIAAALEKGQS